MAITRTWPALFALGAGLIHIALGAAITTGGRGAGATAVLVALLALGAAEIVWAGAVLREGRAVLPRVAVGTSAVAVMLSAAAIAIGGSVAAAAVAILFTVLTGAIVARGLSRPRTTSTAPRPGRSFAGMAIGALVVASACTAVIVTTDAGSVANYHDHVQLPDSPHQGH